MAKAQTNQENMVEEQIPTQVITKKANAAPVWEVKDRLYQLADEKQPLVFTISGKHSAVAPLLYYDPELKYQRELRYATNQQSVFADEQKGESTLGRIVFRDGMLRVPKEQQNLQKLLSIYHPLKNQAYIEYDAEQDSIDDLDWINLEIEALMCAKGLDIDHAEAVLRSEFGSKVGDLTSSELKRDLLVFAKRNPVLFLQLANDDNVSLRNVGIKATEMGLIQLSEDQRTFTFGDSKRKLMTVPFDEHPYSALAAWFKTDEGMEVYKNIEKRLK
jgi:hypothetical protein